MTAQEIAALAKAHNMAVGGFYVFKGSPRQTHQLKPDRHEMLSCDRKRRGGQQMVNVGDAPGDRIFNRDHRQSGFAAAGGGEDVFKGGAREGFELGMSVAAGDMGIGAQ